MRKPRREPPATLPSAPHRHGVAWPTTIPSLLLKKHLKPTSVINVTLTCHLKSLTKASVSTRGDAPTRKKPRQPGCPSEVSCTLGLCSVFVSIVFLGVFSPFEISFADRRDSRLRCSRAVGSGSVAGLGPL